MNDSPCIRHALKHVGQWIAISLLLLATGARPAQAAPKLLSLYPLGGQRGTTIDIDVRGTELTGTRAVWLGADTKPISQSKERTSVRTRAGGIDAQVKAVPDASRVVLRLVIAPDARLGFHTIGLISPSGLSGDLSFWVGPNSVVREEDGSHETPAQAQALRLPVAVSGRITGGAEIDCYAFDILSEQTVGFELISVHGPNFDPQLALFETGGSFLDAQRSRRLVFREEITIHWASNNCW